MSGQIPEEFINDLRHRVDIVEVIREYVPLKKQGQNYSGLCPFHSEKTPSFVVSPQKQIFHCFGCGKGGNVFSFLMEKNSCTFPDAIHALATHEGIALPLTSVSPEKAREESLKKKHYHINETAANFYREALQGLAGKKVLTYLHARGITHESRERFLLGYAPESWDQLSRFLLSKGISGTDLILLGLSVKSRKGTLVDRFRNRLIFPITDDVGRIIGFGGRVLDDSHPKYLNSPDTPLFQKGKFLYGLNLAKGHIRERDQVIIMEGYMDIITAHQHGINNTVGTLGTALTTAQARLIMRYTYHTALAFDADTAGHAAAVRGMDLLKQQGCQVSIITIPGAKDPDEFIKNEGGDGFTHLVAHASTLLEYKLSFLIQEHNVESVTAKIRIIQELVEDILKENSPVARQAFIQVLSDRLSIPEQVIHAEIRKSRDQNTRHDTGKERKRQDIKDTAVEKAQKVLVQIVMEIPDSFVKVEEWGGINLFNNEIYKEIYHGNYLIRQAGHNIKADDLVSLLNNIEAQHVLREILLGDRLPEDWERIMKDCLVRLKVEFLNRQIAAQTTLMGQLEKSGDVSKSIELMAQIQDMVQEKHRLATTLRKGGDLLEN